MLTRRSGVRKRPTRRRDSGRRGGGRAEACAARNLGLPQDRQQDRHQLPKPAMFERPATSTPMMVLQAASARPSHGAPRNRISTLVPYSHAEPRTRGRPNVGQRDPEIEQVRSRPSGSRSAPSRAVTPRAVYLVEGRRTHRGARPAGWGRPAACRGWPVRCSVLRRRLGTASTCSRQRGGERPSTSNVRTWAHPL